MYLSARNQLATCLPRSYGWGARVCNLPRRATMEMRETSGETRNPVTAQQPGYPESVGYAPSEYTTQDQFDQAFHAPKNTELCCSMKCCMVSVEARAARQRAARRRAREAKPLCGSCTWLWCFLLVFKLAALAVLLYGAWFLVLVRGVVFESAPLDLHFRSVDLAMTYAKHQTGTAKENEGRGGGGGDDDDDRNPFGASLWKNLSAALIDKYEGTIEVALNTTLNGTNGTLVLEVRGRRVKCASIECSHNPLHRVFRHFVHSPSQTSKHMRSSSQTEPDPFVVDARAGMRARRWHPVWLDCVARNRREASTFGCDARELELLYEGKPDERKCTYAEGSDACVAGFLEVVRCVGDDR